MRISVIVLIVIGFVLLCKPTSAQFGYNQELEPIEGISIKYKFVHEKFFNKKSDINLRLRLENTKDYDVKVRFSIIYEKGIIQTLKSEIIEIEIPANKSRTGKARGLNFDTGTNDMEYINSDDFIWYFDIFEVLKIKNEDE